MCYTGHHTKECVKAGGIHKVEGALWNLDIRKIENGWSGWRGNWRKLIHEDMKTRWSRRKNITVYDNHRRGRNKWSIYSAGGTYTYSWRTKKRHYIHCLGAAICRYFEITTGIDLQMKNRFTAGTVLPGREANDVYKSSTRKLMVPHIQNGRENSYVGGRHMALACQSKIS